MLQRGDRPFTVPLAQLQDLAPISTKVPQWHQGTGDKPQELLPFETDMIAILKKIRTEPDGAKRAALLNEYNHVFTENVYNVGLVTIPAALDRQQALQGRAGRRAGARLAMVGGQHAA